MPLGMAVKMWPTPTAALATGGQVSRGGKRKGELLLAGMAGGKLNPTWVEWLMGWPLEWTDCDPLGTGKFRRWLRLHSEFYTQD